MACVDCSGKTSGYCKVCQLLENDNTIKAVKYCNTCGVYICESCEKDIIARMKAYTLNLKPVQEIKKFLSKKSRI
jgi:hypothetical protein